MKKENDELERKKVKNKLISLNDYYSAPGARDLAHSVKEGDNVACLKIAEEIAYSFRFPKDAVIIPMPSSKGFATSNLMICNRIAEITKTSVSDCIKGHGREKLYDLKKNGSEIEKNFFGFKKVIEPKDGVYFIFDVVVDSARTMLAAKKLFNQKKVFCISHSMVDLEINKAHRLKLDSSLTF